LDIEEALEALPECQSPFSEKLSKQARLLCRRRKGSESKMIAEVRGKDLRRWLIGLPFTGLKQRLYLLQAAERVK